MEKLVKIAEINAQSQKSAELIAEALENAGFQTVVNEDETFKNYIDVLEKK